MQLCFLILVQSPQMTICFSSTFIHTCSLYRITEKNHQKCNSAFQIWYSQLNFFPVQSLTYFRCNSFHSRFIALHYGKINLLGWLFYTFIYFYFYFAKKSFSRWAQKNIFLVAGQNIHLTYNMYSQLVIFRRYSIVFFQNHLTFKHLLFPLAKLELWPWKNENSRLKYLHLYRELVALTGQNKQKFTEWVVGRKGFCGAINPIHVYTPRCRGSADQKVNSN